MMKKALVIFLVVFLVLALATPAFAAKPDKSNKVTGLDNKVEKVSEKSNDKLAGPNNSGGFEGSTDYSSLSSSYDGKWTLDGPMVPRTVLLDPFEPEADFEGLELFTESNKATGDFYYIGHDGTWWPQGTLSLRVSKDGTLTGRWVYDNWKVYDYGKGFIEISYDDSSGELVGHIGYKKNALDYMFVYDHYVP